MGASLKQDSKLDLIVRPLTPDQWPALEAIIC
jgi:hypothetical protein